MTSLVLTRDGGFCNKKGCHSRKAGENVGLMEQRIWWQRTSEKNTVLGAALALMCAGEVRSVLRPPGAQA